MLELFNSEVDEIPSERVAKAVEAAVGLLGSASCHISALRRTKILEEYNKDLVTWVQDHEPDFFKDAPLLFGTRMPQLTWNRCQPSEKPDMLQLTHRHHHRVFGEASNPAHQGGTAATSGAGRCLTHQ